MTDIVKWNPDGNMTDQIASAASTLARLLLTGEYGGIDYILEILDQDPSWETAAVFIGYLTGMNEITKWGIGEVLYFLRFKASFTTVYETPHKDRDDPLPDDLYDFIRKRYNRELRAVLADTNTEIADVLGWRIYQTNPFWLLVGKGYVRVWNREPNPVPNDQEWSDTIGRTFTPMLKQLNANTARSYYATVATYPSREDRIEGVAWTAHLELRNQLGNSVPKEVRGDERHKTIGAMAVPKMQELYETGQATVPAIRAETAKINREKKGFVWEFPPIGILMVRDPDTGEQAPAIQIYNLSYSTYFIYITGLSRRDRPEFPVMVWDEKMGTVTDRETGEVVAAFRNRGLAVVQAAENDIVQKANWRIKGVDDV